MKKTYIYSLLFLATTLEVFSQTYWNAYGNKDVAAILYILCGLAIGLLPLIKSQVSSASAKTLYDTGSRTWGFLLFGIIALAGTYFGYQAIQKQALDYTLADMLPIIQIMGERWLDGGDVYAVIPEIWDGMQPIYLPAMWLPYVPAIWAEIDIRWVNLSFILLSCALASRFWKGHQWRFFPSYGVYIPLVLLLSYTLVDYTTFLTITEEPLVVGFYALLAYGLLRERSLLIIFALVGCLLSRYALIFWAASYLGYMLWQGNRRRALIIIGGTGLLSLLVLYLSQGIYQLELFYSLKDAYLDSFQDVSLAWRTKSTIASSIGVARFVSFENLIVLHKAVFWGSLLIPPILYVWYHLRLREKISNRLFALCSLKLCLVYFFNMNALPYSYLFYTSTFLSLIVLGQYWQGGQLTSKSDLN